MSEMPPVPAESDDSSEPSHISALAINSASRVNICYSPNANTSSD